MSERDMVRITGILLTVLMALVAGRARAASVKVVDGTCRQENEPAVQAVGVTVAELLTQGKRPCVPLASPYRPEAEKQELALLEKNYDAFVRAACTKNRCLGNEWADAITRLRDAHWLSSEHAKPILAGCHEWADQSADSVVESDPHYWAIHEVKVENMGLGTPDLGGHPENFHWITELQNTRTHERIYLDGWSAAASARDWTFLAPVGASPDSINRKNEVRSGDSVDAWGNVTYRSELRNRSRLCEQA